MLELTNQIGVRTLAVDYTLEKNEARGWEDGLYVSMKYYDLDILISMWNSVIIQNLNEFYV